MGRRRAGRLATYALSALLFVTSAFGLGGCRRSKQPVSPPGVSGPVEPSQELIEKVYQAELKQSESDYCVLLFHKSGEPYLSRTTSNDNLDLRHKLIGKWEHGYKTESYPRSFWYSCFLELSEDNKAKYWTESGTHTVKEDGTFERTKSIGVGPYAGIWKIVGKNGAEIRLYVPKTSPPLWIDPPQSS